MSLSKITERVQKLLAMANNNPNEAEATVAMERAFKLLAKHNLSMTDVEQEEETCMSDGEIIKKGGVWARIISQRIASLYFCDYYVMPIKGRTEKHVFIGTENNVALAKQIAMTVIDIVHNSGKKQAHGSTPFLNSFRNAASYRISARCQEMIEEAKRGDIKEVDEEGNDVGTGMVLASVYDNEKKRIEAWKAKADLNLKTKSSRGRSTDMGGVSAGIAAGNSVGLRPSISGKSQSRLK